ncbi:MAG: hypothetical protein QF790_03795 [Gammaproteobacteria bacterium]|jgi:hypothetical protein|nr:hypothetical protein [Gammaproteobacteria bacterium]
MENATPGPGYGSLIMLLAIMLSYVPVIYMLAKEKGRNATKWVILAIIPIVNLWMLLYAIAATNLKLERKIDALLKAQNIELA